MQEQNKTSKKRYKKLQAKIIAKVEKLHPADGALLLKKLARKDIHSYQEILKKLPNDLIGQILLNLPDNLKDESYEFLSINKLKNVISDLDSDDATDIVLDIEDFSKQKANKVFKLLDKDDREEISQLKKYDDEEAGSFMQLELFKIKSSATVQKAIKEFKKLKKQEDVSNIYQMHLLDKDNKFKCSLPIESLILFDSHETFDEILTQAQEEDATISPSTHYALDTENIKSVVRQFEKYDLSVICVVDKDHNIVGRITNDDIIDIIEDASTKDAYQLAGVDKELDYEDGVFKTAHYRGVWLGINLLTAILASIVIGVFDETLRQYVALAILMPIVASMGGNAGTQSLSVMVRQLALLSVEEKDFSSAIKKEILVSCINGLVFAFVISVIVYLWFNSLTLSIVLACSMIITLFMAGFFGALIPIMLNKLNADPAVGSSVVLTTITDIFGFLSFLGLASIFMK